MKKVLGIGNSLVDILVKIPNDDFLEKFGLAKGSMVLVDLEKSQTVLNEVKDYIEQKSAGGSAANAITGISKLGAETGFIGKIGNDETGNFFKNDLENNKVKTIMFKSENGSGRVAALISKDAERTFATYLGASVELCAEDLSLENFQGYDVCFIEGYLVQNHKLIETACDYAKKSGCKVCLDLASFNVVEENLDFLKDMVEKYIDIVFANEEEAKAFTGLEPEDALNKIAKTAEIAVVKIGKKGSMIKCDGKIYKSGIIEANAIDTTGAGDLYASGFLYGYINGFDFEKCAKIGAITSGNVVETMGAKMSDETWKKINSLVKAL